MKPFTIAFLLFVVPIANQPIFAQRITIELPSVARLLGIGSKTEIVVMNMTPFYGRVLALGDEVAVIPPAGVIRDRRTFDFDQTQLPLVVQLYSDAALCTFVGVAARNLHLTLGQPESWQIQLGEVVYPDARSSTYWGGYRSPYPLPDFQEPSAVELPSIQMRSTTALQVVNATLFEAVVMLNGNVVSRLATGDMYYRSFFNVYDYDVPVLLQVQFLDRERVVGRFEDRFSAGKEPRGIQYILNPSWISWF